jgi:hypothetical protein
VLQRHVGQRTRGAGWRKYLASRGAEDQTWDTGHGARERDARGVNQLAGHNA